MPLDTVTQTALDAQMSDEEPRGNGFEFALDSPQGTIRQASSGGDPDPVSAPSEVIDETRAAVRNGPYVGEAVDTLTDYIVGTGYNIAPRNIEGVDDAQLLIEDIGEVKKIVELSDFGPTLWSFVRHALVDGVAFMEINWRDETVFEPLILPAKDMSIMYDEFGRVQGYELDSGQGDPVEYGKYEVAHLGFFKHPKEDWFQPLVDRILDQYEILRDMELDMARFVASKAYPPILWKLGDETQWSPSEIEQWMDQLEEIQPDTMMVSPGDVETETVGVSDSAQTSGALNLEPMFQQMQKRIATGLGLPLLLLNGDGPGRNDAVAQMPKFDRRIKRYRDTVRTCIEQQILHSLYYNDSPEEHEGEMVPRFEFGSHSSEEERLEKDTALKMFNNLLLTPKAFAEKTGQDFETDIPDIWKGLSPEEHKRLVLELAGVGDSIQNPDGGAPTDTQGGTDSSGGEATTRQNPERDSSGSDSRNKQPVEDSDPAAGS